MVAEHPLARCFSRFAGIEVIVHMLVNHLLNQSRPDLVGDDVFHGVMYPSTDLPLSTEGACAEELLNGFFRHVQDCSHPVFDLPSDFSGDQLLQCGGEGAVGLFCSWADFHLLSLNILKVAFRVMALFGMQDCFPSAFRGDFKLYNGCIIITGRCIALLR